MFQYILFGIQFQIYILYNIIHIFTHTNFKKTTNNITQIFLSKIPYSPKKKKKKGLNTVICSALKILNRLKRRVVFVFYVFFFLFLAAQINEAVGQVQIRSPKVLSMPSRMLTIEKSHFVLPTQTQPLAVVLPFFLSLRHI